MKMCRLHCRLVYVIASLPSLTIVLSTPDFSQLLFECSRCNRNISTYRCYPHVTLIPIQFSKYVKRSKRLIFETRMQLLTDLPHYAWEILIRDWISYKDVVYFDHSAPYSFRSLLLHCITTFCKDLKLKLRTQISVREGLWIRKRLGLQPLTAWKFDDTAIPRTFVDRCLYVSATELNSSLLRTIAAFQKLEFFSFTCTQMISVVVVPQLFCALPTGCSVSIKLVTESFPSRWEIEYNSQDQAFVGRNCNKGLVCKVLSTIFGLRSVRLTKLKGNAKCSVIESLSKHANTLEKLDLWDLDEAPDWFELFPVARYIQASSLVNVKSALPSNLSEIFTRHWEISKGKLTIYGCFGDAEILSCVLSRPAQFPVAKLHLLKPNVDASLLDTLTALTSITEIEVTDGIYSAVLQRLFDTLPLINYTQYSGAKDDFLPILRMLLQSPCRSTLQQLEWRDFRGHREAEQDVERLLCELEDLQVFKWVVQSLDHHLISPQTVNTFARAALSCKRLKEVHIETFIVDRKLLSYTLEDADGILLAKIPYAWWNHVMCTRRMPVRYLAGQKRPFACDCDNSDRLSKLAQQSLSASAVSFNDDISLETLCNMLNHWKQLSIIDGPRYKLNLGECELRLMLLPYVSLQQHLDMIANLEQAITQFRLRIYTLALYVGIEVCCQNYGIVCSAALKFLSHIDSLELRLHSSAMVIASLQHLSSAVPYKLRTLRLVLADNEGKKVSAETKSTVLQLLKGIINNKNHEHIQHVVLQLPGYGISVSDFEQCRRPRLKVELL